MVMETAGVVIGIPALISLTAKTYLAVNRRIEQYRNYDKDVECILTRVHIAEKIFELHIRKLLTETIGEENTELLLKPLDKDSPTNNDIGIQISNALGDYGQLLYDCIKRVHNVLEQMIEIELHEGPLDVCTETQSVVSLTVSRAQHILDRLSSKKKLGKRTMQRIIGEQRHKLLLLLQALQDENENLHKLLDLQMAQNQIEINQSQRKILTALTQSASPTAVDFLIRTSPEVLWNHRTTREASKRLYDTLLQFSPCSCHCYLCLETCCNSSRGEILQSNFPGAVDRQSGTTFTILVVSKGTCDPQTMDLSTPTQHNSCEEIFLEITKKPRDPDINHHPPCPGLCGTLFADRQELEYVLDNFHVQRIQCRQEYARNEPPPAAITLRELLQDRNRIKTYERLLLAAKLGDAAFTFHSSPWMEFWEATTITYLAAYESSEQPATWTPHIANPLASDRLTMLNDGMYRLGMILLEVGGITQEELHEIEKPTNNEEHTKQAVLAQKKILVEVALSGVTRQMGSAFKKAVEQCFIFWYHGAVSEEEVMTWFQTMKKLEALAYDCYRDDA